ncbi:MAG TPA: hypothetical protein VFI31_12510 [Pirellulales bacterium]|nr:hypothetical protein [Pirellulales bacterium]
MSVHEASPLENFHQFVGEPDPLQTIDPFAEIDMLAPVLNRLERHESAELRFAFFWDALWWSCNAVASVGSAG